VFRRRAVAIGRRFVVAQYSRLSIMRPKTAAIRGMMVLTLDTLPTKIWAWKPQTDHRRARQAFTGPVTFRREFVWISAAGDDQAAANEGQLTVHNSTISKPHDEDLAHGRFRSQPASSSI
jgi:hypothetical protein